MKQADLLPEMKMSQLLIELPEPLDQQLTESGVNPQQRQALVTGPEPD